MADAKLESRTFYVLLLQNHQAGEVFPQRVDLFDNLKDLFIAVVELDSKIRLSSLITLFEDLAWCDLSIEGEFNLIIHAFRR